MVKQQILSRSTPLLLESGALASDPAAGLVGSRDVILSRALCRFRLYTAPNALSSAQLAKASRLYADAHAPFANCGSLILRSPRGAEIWYWDKTKLGSLGQVKEVSPESVWRGPGDGWRVVACAEGHEAQYWEERHLIASSWRRLPFTEEQWSAFALSVANPATPAPAAPPVAALLAKSNGSWRRRTIKEPVTWRDAERAGVSIAICGAAVAAFLSGQALRADAKARDAQMRGEVIVEAIGADGDVARAMAQRQLLRDFAAAFDQPLVLSAAADAHEVLAQYGLRASSWRVNDEGVSLIVDAALTDAPVRDIVAAMETKPHLCNAVPEIAGVGRFEVRASIETPGGGCATPSARRQS